MTPVIARTESPKNVFKQYTINNKSLVHQVLAYK